jgi:hypothetical protein
LSGDLQDIFDAMNDMANGGNRYMADGIADAIQTSLETGKTSGSVYSGSITAGDVTSTVNGTFESLDASSGVSDGADAIFDACEKMNSDGKNANNDDLWKAIVKCCTEITTNAVVKESLAGTAVPPSAPNPPTVTVSGAAEGKLIDSAGTAPLLSTLQIIPDAMGESGDNSKMVAIMAPAILAYFAKVVVNLSGTGATSGLSATNKLAGNS